MSATDYPYPIETVTRYGKIRLLGNNGPDITVILREEEHDWGPQAGVSTFWYGVIGTDDHEEWKHFGNAFLWYPTHRGYNERSPDQHPTFEEISEEEVAAILFEAGPPPDSVLHD